VVRVHAVSPERDESEIRFPRVDGYRTQLPQDRLTAQFTADSVLELTPDLVGATETIQSGIVGDSDALTLEHLKDERTSTIAFRLANRIVTRQLTAANEVPNAGLIMQMRTIVRAWMSECLVLKGGTVPSQLLYHAIADHVSERIMAAISRGEEGGGRVLAILDPYNPQGSTRHVGFTTSKDRYETGPRCHVNFAVLDSDWEAEFCRVADGHARVLAWVKNHNLGFEVPYMGAFAGGAGSYAKLAQIAGARSYLLLPSTVAPERRRLSSIRRWLRILKVSGPTRRYSMKPRERQNRSAASFASSTANRISVAPLAAAQLSTVE
jgi:type III restriction enzyme